MNANALRVMACVFCKTSTFQEWVAEQTGAAAGEAEAKRFLPMSGGEELRDAASAPIDLTRSGYVEEPLGAWEHAAVASAIQKLESHHAASGPSAKGDEMPYPAMVKGAHDNMLDRAKERVKKAKKEMVSAERHLNKLKSMKEPTP